MVLFKCDDYNEAQSMVEALHAELLRINVNAARSLNEGIDDMFTLSRLGVHAIFGRCFLSTKPASPLRASIAALPDTRVTSLDGPPPINACVGLHWR